MSTPLTLHGVMLHLEHDQTPAARDCVDRLREDFAAWSFVQGALVGTGGSARLKLHAARAPVFDEQTDIRIFSTRMCEVHGTGKRRWLKYGERDCVLLDSTDSQALEASIFCEQPDDLHEIAYTAAIALVGELMDARGLHRVHALGFCFEGRNALCLFGEKSGKSTLAMALKTRFAGEVRFFSDETPLLRGSRLLAYPNRLALTPEALSHFGEGAGGPSRAFKRKLFPEKRLFSWKAEELAQPGPVDFLFLEGAHDHDEGAFVKVSALAAGEALTRSMVVGLGVAQMAEYFLRFDPGHLARLSAIAASRAATAGRVAWTAKSFVFKRTDDPLRNAGLITEFMKAIPVEARK